MKEEAKTVSILALGFGSVGIDRYLITPLFPVIAHNLHLGYGDIGTIAGALAIAWSIAALLMGNLSDRIGRRAVSSCDRAGGGLSADPAAHGDAAGFSARGASGGCRS